MTQEEKEFGKKCIEQIPPWDMKAIDKEVSERVRKVFGNDELHLTSMQYCTSCSWNKPLSKMFKTRCISFVQTGESLCCSCYAERMQKELCEKWFEAHKPKLDVNDFARI